MPKLLRPASQHLFRLAAEAEGMMLMLDGLSLNRGDGDIPPEDTIDGAVGSIESAASHLQIATSHLLRAGNALQPKREAS